MFSKKIIASFFSMICISALICCSSFNKEKSNSSNESVATHKKVTTRNIMKEAADPKTAKLKLYVYLNCPYCRKVTNFIRSNSFGNEIAIIDVTIDANMKELLATNNGETQCPFLYDIEKNVKMLESADIISYLSTRFQ